MAMVVKNNLSAVRTLNQVNRNNSELSKRLAKVSSGMKINSAGDDASGYSISERMRVQIRSLDQDLQNVQNGSAMLQTASGGVDDIVNILRTMKEKAIDAANDSNSDEDRATIQKELTQLTATINDVALGNEYNGKRLLTGIYDPKTKYTDAATRAVEVAKGMMTSLNETNLTGTAALDEAIKAASNGKFATTDALVSKFLSDLDSSASATDFLSDYCDIILGNDDTGAITGSDAGGDTTKTAVSIVPEQSEPASWIEPTSTTSTFEGLTVSWPSTGVGGAALTSEEKHILKGLNSEWIEQSLKLVKESFGIDFTDGGATVNNISIAFENDSTNNRLAAVESQYNLTTGKATRLTLIVNMHYYNNIDTSSADGELDDSDLTLKAQAGRLDRTIAHEFTHAVMSANINHFADLPKYIKEGTAELVHGIDDQRDLANLLGRPDDLEAVFAGTRDVQDEAYSAGYMLLRYLAKQGQSTTGGRIGENTRFNPIAIQHGTQAGQHMNIFIKDMQTKSLTAGDIFNSNDELINESDKARYEALNYDPDKQAEWLETLHAAEGMTIDDISVRTKEDANIAIRVIDGALEYSLDNATTIGAYQQRLEYTATNITTSNENTQASESTIRDADMAKEMTAYTKANVLLQAAQAMLAQASQSPSNVLSLLR